MGKFDDWLDANPAADVARPVLDKIIFMQEHYDKLFAEPAPLGARPLVREVDVAEASVTIVVYLQHPNRGIHILSINNWT